MNKNERFINIDFYSIVRITIVNKMEMKDFKKGDRVKDSSYGEGVVHSVTDTVNVIFDKSSPDLHSGCGENMAGNYDCSYYEAWQVAELRLINRETTKFKVGDKVKVLNGTGSELITGELGVVSDFRRDRIAVKVPRLNSDAGCLSYSNELELIQEEEPIKSNTIDELKEEIKEKQRKLAKLMREEKEPKYICLLSQVPRNSECVVLSNGSGADNIYVDAFGEYIRLNKTYLVLHKAAWKDAKVISY